MWFYCSGTKSQIVHCLPKWPFSQSNALTKHATVVIFDMPAIAHNIISKSNANTLKDDTGNIVSMSMLVT